MKKDIKIDGRLQRVYVLSENDERIAYISLKNIHRVDYDRLNEISERAGNRPMLDQMKKEKLSNGQNALVQYDSIIQVADKNKQTVGGQTALRLKKPEEAILQVEASNLTKPADVVEVPEKVVAPVLTEQSDNLDNDKTPETPAKPGPKPRRKPGPKPKAKTN